MATSLAIMILLGLLFNTLFVKLKMPGFLGMLILGVLVGPYVLNWLDPELLKASSDFRKRALIIILLRAGLGISIPEEIQLGITQGFLGSLVPFALFNYTLISYIEKESYVQALKFGGLNIVVCLLLTFYGFISAEKIMIRKGN